MADEKISAMTVTTVVDETLDYIPIVQGGVNKKVARNWFLSAMVTGQTVGFTGGSGSFITVGQDDLIDITVNGGAALNVNNANGDQLTVEDNAIRFDMTGAGVFTLASAAGGIFTMDAAGQITITPASGLNPTIFYAVGDPSNWNTPDILDICTALDRIAAALVARTIGGPIP